MKMKGVERKGRKPASMLKGRKEGREEESKADADPPRR
jgi:hypothetical protein